MEKLVMSQYQEDDGFGWGGVGMGLAGLGAGVGLGTKFGGSIRGALGKAAGKFKGPPPGAGPGMGAGLGAAAGAGVASQAMGGGTEAGPPAGPPGGGGIRNALDPSMQAGPQPGMAPGPAEQGMAPGPAEQGMAPGPAEQGGEPAAKIPGATLGPPGDPIRQLYEEQAAASQSDKPFSPEEQMQFLQTAAGKIGELEQGGALPPEARQGMLQEAVAASEQLRGDKKAVGDAKASVRKLFAGGKQKLDNDVFDALTTLALGGRSIDVRGAVAFDELMKMREAAPPGQGQSATLKTMLSEAGLLRQKDGIRSQLQR